MSDKPRVLVLLPEVPNVRGGAERLADALCSHLNAAGARAEVFTAPFRWEPKEIVISEALTWRLHEPEADLVIPIKFPAYFVRHPNKVAWVAHQFRQLYEFHGTPLSAFANTPPDHELREKLVEMETRCLRECRAVSAGLLPKQIRLPPFHEEHHDSHEESDQSGGAQDETRAET